MADPAAIFIALLGPIGTGITALLLLSGKFGKLEGKERVSKANMDNVVSDVDKQGGEIKNIDKRLNELTSEQNLMEYIIKETKELLKENNSRLTKIELSMARLRTSNGSYGHDEPIKREKRDALGGKNE